MDVQNQEQQRLAAVRALDVLDSAPEEAFDAIVKLAARICATPVALITLVDEVRQWFKARVGLDIHETPREIAFCTHAITGRTLCTVPDATADARFCSNPLVLGEPQIRFYAGVPLVTRNGFAVGTLCVIDRVARAGLEPHQREALELLARETMVQFELRRTLKEVADAKSTVDHLNRELEAFGAALAHDMRAPVRHISGYLQLLSEELADRPAVQPYLERIGGACTRMRDIIDALLRLSHASHDALTRTPVDLSAMAQEILAELQAAEPHRRVETLIEPGVEARADANMIRVALANLLSNAWKFTHARTPARIEFGRRRSMEGEAYFVRDNGVGFDASVALLPAKPFKRHRSEEGVGLGLTLVERIIQRHGGALTVEGAPDLGATFTFTLKAR